MRTRHSKVMVAAAALCFALAACVDSPTGSMSAADENQLATSFDDLAQEQVAAGDDERGEEFRWAALAVRFGVTPSLFEVRNDGQAEVYSAFVDAVKWTLPILASRPLTHRTFVAWRKTPEKMQVILISSHLDLAPVLHPYSMRLAPGATAQASPVAGAHAAYFERGTNGKAWLGVSGQVRMAEASVAGPCNTPPSNRPSGVTCELARYAVGFDVMFAPTGPRPRDVDAAATRKHIVAPEQSVAGVKLTFTCAAPASNTGCR